MVPISLADVVTVEPQAQGLGLYCPDCLNLDKRITLLQAAVLLSGKAALMGLQLR